MKVMALAKVVSAGVPGYEQLCASGKTGGETPPGQPARRAALRLKPLRTPAYT